MKYLFILTLLLAFNRTTSGQSIFKDHEWYCAKYMSLGDTISVNRSNQTFAFGYGFKNSANGIKGNHYYRISSSGISDCGGEWVFKGDELTLYGNGSDCPQLSYKVIQMSDASFQIWIDKSSQAKYYMVRSY